MSISRTFCGLVALASLFAMESGRSAPSAVRVGPAVHAQAKTKLPPTTAPTPKEQDETHRLQRVRALKDPVLSGDVPTYYRPGYEDHARDLQKFLEGERGFVKKVPGNAETLRRLDRIYPGFSAWAHALGGRP